MNNYETISAFTIMFKTDLDRQLQDSGLDLSWVERAFTSGPVPTEDALSICFGSCGIQIPMDGIPWSTVARQVLKKIPDKFGHDAFLNNKLDGFFTEAVAGEINDTCGQSNQKD